MCLGIPTVYISVRDAIWGERRSLCLRRKGFVFSGWIWAGLLFVVCVAVWGMLLVVGLKGHRNVSGVVLSMNAVGLFLGSARGFWRAVVYYF